MGLPSRRENWDRRASTKEIVCRRPFQMILRQKDLIRPETLRFRPESVENVPNSTARMQALQGSGEQDTSLKLAECATRRVT